jgi:hypothetical protein
MFLGSLQFYLMDCILGTQVCPSKQPTSNVGKSGEDVSTSVPKKVPIAAPKKRKSTKTEKQQKNDGFARCVIAAIPNAAIFLSSQEKLTDIKRVK